MNRNVISTTDAPAAIGPYNQAVSGGGLVFTAGQIPLIPGTKQIVDGGVADQTERVLENLKAVLEAAGSSLDRVVKTTVYLRDMSDFPAMNDVYARYFDDDAPARSTVAVSGLPMDVLVEIDAVALHPDHS
jgi:2-iminobutanoate/2-iminopropanoate deaminase